MEKHELSKIDFEIIDDAFNTLLQYRPDPVIVDLRNMFRDAHTGWLEDRERGGVITRRIAVNIARLPATAKAIIGSVDLVIRA